MLYTKSDIGKPKAEVAAQFLERQSFCSEIRSYSMDILDNRNEFMKLVEDADFVFSVVDQLNTRFFITAACLKAKKPMCSGGTFVIDGFATQAEIQKPEGKPCLACNMFRQQPPLDWVNYYAGFTDDKENRESGLDLKKISEFDKSIRLPSRDASTYITASTGSNLMIALMINWFMGNYIPERLVFNLITPYFDKDKVASRGDCVLCGRMN